MDFINFFIQLWKNPLAEERQKERVLTPILTDSEITEKFAIFGCKENTPELVKLMQLTQPPACTEDYESTESILRHLKKHYRRQGDHKDNQGDRFLWLNQPQTKTLYLQIMEKLGVYSIPKVYEPYPRENYIAIIPGSLEKRFAVRAGLLDSYIDKYGPPDEVWVVTGERTLEPHECPKLKHPRTEEACLKAHLDNYLLKHSNLRGKVINAPIHNEAGIDMKGRATTVDNALILTQENIQQDVVLFIETPFAKRMGETFRLVHECTKRTHKLKLFSGFESPDINKIPDSELYTLGSEIVGFMMLHAELPTRLENLITQAQMLSRNPKQ